MLSVVTGACTLRPDLSSGIIVIESDFGDPFQRAHDELNGPQAKTMAISYASQAGVDGPRMSGNVRGPYPVNDAGVPLDEVVPFGHESLPMTDKKMQVARFRVDVPVHRSVR